MSALGHISGHLQCKMACPLLLQKRTCAVQLGMSSKGQQQPWHRSFDHLICSVEQTIWNGEAQRFGGLEIDH